MKVRIVLIALVASTALALAHTGATGIVKERMDGMPSLAQSMKALAQLAKSDDVDQRQVIEIARQIKKQSGVAMSQRFPIDEQQMVSEASPAIWENWKEFEQISDELFQAAVALESSALNGNM
jgi:cytochrome c556